MLLRCWGVAWPWRGGIPYINIKFDPKCHPTRPRDRVHTPEGHAVFSSRHVSTALSASPDSVLLYSGTALMHCQQTQPPSDEFSKESRTAIRNHLPCMRLKYSQHEAKNAAPEAPHPWRLAVDWWARHRHRPFIRENLLVTRSRCMLRERDFGRTVVLDKVLIFGVLSWAVGSGSCANIL